MVDGGGQVLDLKVSLKGCDLGVSCSPIFPACSLPSSPPCWCVSRCWGGRATGMCKGRCGMFHVLTSSCVKSEV